MFRDRWEGKRRRRKGRPQALRRQVSHLASWVRSPVALRATGRQRAWPLHKDGRRESEDGMGNLGGDGMGGGGAWNPGMAQALGYGYGMPTQAAPDYSQMMSQLGGGQRPSAYAGLGYPSSYGYGSA